jgi:hypothetical protein
MRHTPVDLADGTKLVVTVHPSALLRIGMTTTNARPIAISSPI